MSMTFVEKILAKYSGEKNVIPSQIVTVHPDHLLTHDNTAPIIQKITDDLKEYGVYSKSLPIIALDHVTPAASEKTASNHKAIRDFVKTYNLENFFDVGVGVSDSSDFGGCVGVSVGNGVIDSVAGDDDVDGGVHATKVTIITRTISFFIFSTFP